MRTAACHFSQASTRKITRATGTTAVRYKQHQRVSNRMRASLGLLCMLYLLIFVGQSDRARSLAAPGTGATRPKHQSLLDYGSTSLVHCCCYCYCCCCCYWCCCWPQELACSGNTRTNITTDQGRRSKGYLSIAWWSSIKRSATRVCRWVTNTRVGHDSQMGVSAYQVSEDL